MATIILYVDLEVNGDKLDTNMASKLAEIRLHNTTETQPRQLDILDTYLQRGFTAVFSGQTTRSENNRQVAKAVFILHKSDGPDNQRGN